MGALDLRDRRRFLVGGAPRRVVDDGAQGRRQPAPPVRVPPQRRRSASGAMDPRQAQLRDGQRALSASAMGALRRSLGVALPDATSSSPSASGCWHSCRTACRASWPLLVNHRPKALRGRSLSEALGVAERQPARLTELFRAWNRVAGGDVSRPADAGVRRARPGIRRRAASRRTTKVRLLAKLLTHWALRSTLDASSTCVAATRPKQIARAAWLRREERVTIH